MSTIIVAALLISVIMSICLILVSIDNKHRKKTSAALLYHFSKLGTENNLSFTSQEILENCVIGLDGIQRKLLVLRKINNNEYDPILLDLNEVKSCSKKTIYKGVDIGTGKKEKFKNQIDKIVLDFDLIDNTQPVQILFFDPIANHVFAMSALEQKAKKWEMIISQIANSCLKKTA